MVGIAEINGVPTHKIPQCVLCSSTAAQTIADVENYFHCPECDLRFLDPQLRLKGQEEKSRYDIHRNDIEDPRYREFLSPLFTALDSRVSRHSSGLDFGCGPASALAEMFKEGGHSMALYDPFYQPHTAVLRHQSYDFISSSEAAEHFFQPHEEFRRLHSLLKPGGWLGIMTQLTTPAMDFKNWYYRRDPTHVVFYSLQTFRWIEKHLGFTQMVDAGPRVVVLQRPS